MLGIAIKNIENIKRGGRLTEPLLKIFVLFMFFMALWFLWLNLFFMAKIV